MLRRDFLKNIGILTGTAGLIAPALEASAINRGGGNMITGKVLDGKKGVANVSVTDGYSVVRTNKNGDYSLSSNINAEFVYISVPAGFVIPHQNGVAAFYSSIKNRKDKQSVNFTLDKLPTDDNKHGFIVWGDTQILTDEDANMLKTISAPDTKKLLQSIGNVPFHGIGCGDLVFDQFHLFKDYKEAVAITGIPFFQVIGNHDIDTDSRSDDGSQATFKSQFGPTYYSFNRGKIHYVVLDNVFFIGAGKRYIGYITETQLQWLENDLAHVAKGSTVVVSLHIPTDNGDAKRSGEKQQQLGGVTANRQALYDLLKDFNVHIMSGHTHFNENWEKDNIMEHNHGTVCGAWWSGPVCSDGTPNGYGVYIANGDQLEWHYKSVGFESSHQMVVHGKGSSKEQPQAVVANVWNWDPKWKVEWWEDGIAKGAMQQFIGLDPAAVKLYTGPEIPAKHKWVEPSLTDHLFSAIPAATAKRITIKATDRFGKIYEQTMEI